MTHKKAKRHSAAQPASRLRVLLAAGGALLLVIAALGFWAVRAAETAPAGAGGPQLTVNQERIDFGKVEYDKPVRAEFRLQNSGDATLTLDATTPVRVVEGC